MFKKLSRLMIALVFGMLMLINLSLTLPSGSVSANDPALEGAKGTIFTSSGGTTVCICSGDECLACVAV